MTLKKVVWQAVQQLIQQGKTEFTADDICKKALEIDSTKKRRSIGGTLYGLTKGSSHNFYTENDKFLERVGFNLYKYFS
jgi:ribosomal protein L31